jgi:hypothetical protein
MLTMQDQDVWCKTLLMLHGRCANCTLFALLDCVPQVMDWTFEWVELRMRARDWLPDGDVVLGSRVGLGGWEEAEDADVEGDKEVPTGEECVRVACNATWREVQVQHTAGPAQARPGPGRQPRCRCTAGGAGRLPCRSGLAQPAPSLRLPQPSLAQPKSCAA